MRAGAARGAMLGKLKERKKQKERPAKKKGGNPEEERKDAMGAHCETTASLSDDREP